MTKKRMLFIVCPVLIALTIAIALMVTIRNTKSVPEIGKATTFFWGYEDITDSVTEPIDTKDMDFVETEYSISIDGTATEEEKYQIVENLKKEIANMAVGYVNPETMHGENPTTETEIAVFWNANNEAYTFTTADKEITEIHADGIDKRFLKRLTADGFVMQITEPGEYVCWYYAYDNEGTHLDGFGRRFYVEPAVSTAA